MKEIGRRNVTKEITDVLFDKAHKGTSVKDATDYSITVHGFVVYDMGDNTYHLKFIDKDDIDYYTSSQVFIREFMRIAKTTDDDFVVTPTEATSSKGRKYITIKEAIPAGGNNDAWKNINW